jgi:hypothetical protein
MPISYLRTGEALMPSNTILVQHNVGNVDHTLILLVHFPGKTSPTTFARTK